VRYEFRSQFKTSGIVECQNPNGRAAGWRPPFNTQTLKAEVFGQFIMTRMKKSHYFSGAGIDSCHIRTFVKITMRFSCGHKSYAVPTLWYAQTYQRRYLSVKRLRIEQDVQPVSAFRANAAKLIEQVQSHKRALVLTQRGRSAAVVLAPAEYDRLIETLELLQDVHEANAQIAAGKSVAEKKAKQALLRRSMK